MGFQKISKNSDIAPKILLATISGLEYTIKNFAEILVPDLLVIG